MAKADRLLDRIRQSPKRRSHHIFRRADGRMCNIQATRDGMAKRYQVDQVLEAIDAAS
jgi:hypothetical protein